MNTQDQNSKNPLMPVLFVGHGNPMNALKQNRFTDTLLSIGKKIKTPRAILCISAHWLTAGTWVTHMEKPKTIYDFYGFPDELYQVKYSAIGSPEIAEMIQSLIQNPQIKLDDSSWGLDHGAWTILCKMYPDAQIPVLQLSIDMSEPANFHYHLGQELKRLREKGVLIIGSGNVVHNLRRVEWEMVDQGLDWAIEFNEWVKSHLKSKEFIPLVESYNQKASGQLSVPTPDHYLPMLYVIGAVMPEDQLTIEYEGYDLGSLSMLCFSFGQS